MIVEPRYGLFLPECTFALKAIGRAHPGVRLVIAGRNRNAVFETQLRQER